MIAAARPRAGGDLRRRSLSRRRVPPTSAEASRVCLPLAGPWVVVPAGGVEYELACPLAGYIVAGTDARVAERDVDVSFRGESGSPIGPGVTTRRSVVFRAVRTQTGGRAFELPTLHRLHPDTGRRWARAHVGLRGRPGCEAELSRCGASSSRAPSGARSLVVRIVCPTGSRLVGSTHAVVFRQDLSPSGEMLSAVRVSRAVVDRAVVARVTSTAAAGPRAEVQVRALCARTPMTFGSPLLLASLAVPVAALLAYLWIERKPPRADDLVPEPGGSRGRVAPVELEATPRRSAPPRRPSCSCASRSRGRGSSSRHRPIAPPSCSSSTCPSR